MPRELNYGNDILDSATGRVCSCWVFLLCLVVACAQGKWLVLVTGCVVGAVAGNVSTICADIGVKDFSHYEELLVSRLPLSEGTGGTS